MISLLQQLLQEYEEHEKKNLTSTEWAKVSSFVWEKELFYREVICTLINNLFGNVFLKLQE